MRRIRFTRSDKTTACNVLVIHTDSKTTETMTVNVRGNWTDTNDKTLMKEIRETITDKTIEPLYVLGFGETKEVLLVWYLDEIMSLAHVEPARGSKDNDEEVGE